MSTKPHIIIMIVISMALFVAMGMVGVFLLILWKCDPGLIAIMAGFTGTALGQLGGMLNNTRTAGGPPESVTVANAPSNPVPTESV